MRRKGLPVPDFPAELGDFDPGLWLDRVQWAWARWEYWRAHPEVQPFIDPLVLLQERREARHLVRRGQP